MIIRWFERLVRAVVGVPEHRQWYRCLVCGNEQDLGSWCARCDEEDGRGVLVVPAEE